MRGKTRASFSALLQAMPPKVQYIDAKARYPQLTFDSAKDGFDHVRRIQDNVQFPMRKVIPFPPVFIQRFNRVHDGQEAAPGQFPFIVALNIPADALGLSFYFCGGSILRSDLVVSAAHCIRDAVDDFGGISVIYGTNEWRTAGFNNRFDDIVGVGQGYRAHPEFSFTAAIIKYDIGWIQLPTDLPLKEGTPIDCINIAEQEPAVGDLVTEIGWGATCDTCSVSDTLQYAEGIEVVSDNEVETFFNGLFAPDQFVCTEGRVSEDSAGTCGGDSGGPAVDADGELFGATSFGASFCTQGPNCFSSVVYFKDWLESERARIYKTRYSNLTQKMRLFVACRAPSPAWTTTTVTTTAQTSTSNSSSAGRPSANALLQRCFLDFFSPLLGNKTVPLKGRNSVPSPVVLTVRKRYGMSTSYAIFTFGAI